MHSRVHRRVCTLLKLDEHIDGFAARTVLGTICRWCVTAFSNGLWNIPTPVDQVGSGQPRNTDARQDRRIGRAAVAARTASRREIRAHLAPAMSPRTIENRLLAAGLRSSVPLSRLPFTL